MSSQNERPVMPTQYFYIAFKESGPVLTVAAPTIPMGVMAKTLGQMFGQWIYGREKEMSGKQASTYQINVLLHELHDGLLDAIWHNSPDAKLREQESKKQNAKLQA